MSWHYWLAQRAGYDSLICSEDICTYLRYVVKAAIGIGFLGALAMGLAIGTFVIMGDSIAWLVFIILHGWIDPHLALAFLVGVVISAIIGTIVGAILAGKTIARTDLAKAVYGSLHDKLCSRIEIE